VAGNRASISTTDRPTDRLSAVVFWYPAVGPASTRTATNEYVYEVGVTKDDTLTLAHRYRAYLSNVQRLEGGQLMSLQVNLPDTFGPTVTEAVLALDASFDLWRRKHSPRG
jgi:hypothetical protein